MVVAISGLPGVVTAESFPAIGFEIFQVRGVLQLLCHTGIVQSVAVRVPDGPGIVINVASGVYAIPIAFIAYPR